MIITFFSPGIQNTNTLLYINIMWPVFNPLLCPSVWLYQPWVSAVGRWWLWPLFILRDLKPCLRPAKRLWCWPLRIKERKWMPKGPQPQEVAMKPSRSFYCPVPAYSASVSRLRCLLLEVCVGWFHHVSHLWGVGWGSVSLRVLQLIEYNCKTIWQRGLSCPGLQRNFLDTVCSCCPLPWGSS